MEDGEDHTAQKRRQGQKLPKVKVVPTDFASPYPRKDHGVIIAERPSYLVEEYDLLPKHHYGARTQRSTVQAVLWVVQKIFDAWREGKVLMLITFDVKGAYNGASKEVLLHRMSERRVR